MEITSEFNDAAHGFDGDGATSEDTSAPTPNDPGGTGANLHASASLQEHTKSSPASCEPVWARNEPASVQQSLASAEAELQVLEAGRATPAPRNRANPPPRLLKIVDTATERQREARIRALHAYLEFTYDDGNHAHDQDEGMELAL